jgi:Xaa-Pro aminopeptidase
MLVFFDRPDGGGFERLALGGGSQGGLYAVYRDPRFPGRELDGQAQGDLLRTLATGRDLLEAALGPEYMRRVVRAEDLAVEYLEVRLPEMLPLYRRIMEMAHALMRRALSTEVITPGKTTTGDVSWWLRERAAALDMPIWFQPAVRLQRRRKAGVNFLSGDSAVVIQPGDLLHVDFGPRARRLHAGTRQMAYVPRAGEREAPLKLRRALAQAVRLQESVRQRLKPGRTGNRILSGARLAMRAEGIDGAVYSHPVGDHVHAAGPIIGLRDRQQGVPGRGDVKLIPSSWFSLELAVRARLDAWDGQQVFLGLEEEAALDQQGHTSWVAPPPRAFHLVRMSIAGNFELNRGMAQAASATATVSRWHSTRER